MKFIFRLLLLLIDPLGLIRRFIVRPAVQICRKVYKDLSERAGEHAGPIKEFLLRLGVVGFAVILIVWTAVFMYAAFYYAYMPAISHTRPVHMQFKTCIDISAPCTFPHAHVSLTKKQQLLMVGQVYKVIVNIEMPESPQNLELGMFMVCADMRERESLLRGHSCRSAMMRYRSPLIRSMSTWVMSPLFVLGLKEELQTVTVEVFSHYLEEQAHPITDVYVEIQSQKIQFYTVSLHIVADFTGIRYIMFNWPVLSAVVAINTTLFFIIVVFILSWNHWSNATLMHTSEEKPFCLGNILQSQFKGTNDSFQTIVADDEELSLPDDSKSNSEIDNISSGSKDDEMIFYLPKHETHRTK